jgi:hypothetical protein
MKLCINGYARHGKDTVADMFTMLGLKKFNISEQYALEIYNKRPFGVKYDSPEDAYNDRVNYRKEWYDYIVGKVKTEPFRYVKMALELGDMYVGERNREHFLETKHVYDATIWVDASERLPAESIESCNMQPLDHDYIINNNHDMANLMKEVADVYQYIRADMFLRKD